MTDTDDDRYEVEFPSGLTVRGPDHMKTLMLAEWAAENDAPTDPSGYTVDTTVSSDELTQEEVRDEAKRAVRESNRDLAERLAVASRTFSNGGSP